MKLGKWLGLAVAAVILAEGIWGILVSLTRSLLLPLLARVLGGDPHSPLYLGTGDINVPDLFAAILQLCLAGILFLIIKAWAGKPDELRASPVRKITQARGAAAAPAPTALSAPATPPTPPAPTPAASVAAAAQATPAQAIPAQVIPASPPPRATPVPSAQTGMMQTDASTPTTQVAAAPKKSVQKPATPSKPEKPREVYYNLVGEPINPTEDE